MIFHIDDLTVIHLSLQIVTEYIKLLDGVHSSQNLLTITKDKIHEYLGITINFLLKRGVDFSQYDFI